MVGSKQLGHSQDMQCLCKASEVPVFSNLHQVCVGAAQDSEPKTTHSNDQVIMEDQLCAVIIIFIVYLGVDRCGLSWGSRRGLLEIDQGWTDTASAGDQEKVY